MRGRWARADGASSLSWMSCRVRCESAVLGAESRPGMACLLWTSPAWKMQARDAWIGWNDEQRQRNLQSIVNNGRFLVLPWVRVKGLASKILALSARQMPRDWETRYGCRPLLLETLVDANRFRGTCSPPPNCIHVGKTPGPRPLNLL